MHSIVHGIRARSKRLIQSSLMRFGYRLMRMTEEERKALAGEWFEESAPHGPDDVLSANNPRLRDLRERYARVDAPMARRSLWSQRYLSKELALPSFRADNPYVWQYRYTPENLRRKYYLFARYVAERDPRGLLQLLDEDGAFGCCTFEFEGLPRVSRDLLDSINELHFLDRAMGLFGRTALKVLDIGAGYGRLAHRMVAALPGLERYYCVDAVPESTFLSEFYLEHRRCVARARVVPLDMLAQGLGAEQIDLAINIHSFSEMGYEAVAGWLRLVADLRVPQLFIVPNDAHRLLSYEETGARRELLPLLHSFGYRLALQEPAFRNADFRNWLANQDCFLLFERTTK